MLPLDRVDHADAGGHPRVIKFPATFVFGAATSSYQIEGGAEDDGRGRSIWDTFSQAEGNTRDGTTGEVAIDHYNRLDQDLDLFGELGLRAYRFSIAWPRIRPSGMGPVNQRGLDFYQRLVDGLLDRGILPIATLYHWDLPQALEDAGGWPIRDTAYRFAEYAGLMGTVLGDRVHTWITLNEPAGAAFAGYAEGSHAPGRADHVDALKAIHHMNLGHGLAVSALRAAVTNDAQYSISLNLMPLSGQGPGHAEAVRRMDASFNRSLTGPLLRGAYPEDLLEDTHKLTDWSFCLAGDLQLIHQPLDVLGVNYYFRPTLKALDRNSPERGAGRDWPAALEAAGDRTQMGWPVDPQGLEELLLDLTASFPGLPLMVTENGAAYEDQMVAGRVADPQRLDYIRRHLMAVHRAIQRGADVRGYLLWTVFDNFEWAEGFTKKFGIIHVEDRTLERTIKDSGRWYAEVCRSHHFDAGPQLEPCVRRFLDRTTELRINQPPATDVAARRANGRCVSESLFAEFGEPGPATVTVQDVIVPVDAGQIRARIYRPAADGPLPLHLLLHGGGWTGGSIDESVVDATCRERAAAAGCAVASVDYRLAPEHPFPTPLMDCYAALSWLVGHSQSLGLLGAAVSVGGASAGGNLAAALTLLCRERGGPALAFQLLEVPALDLRDTALDVDLAIDVSVDALPQIVWEYAAGAPLDDPLLSPLRAENLRGLPPAHIMTAELDPLREQGEQYADRLRAAGIAVTNTRHPRALHGSGYLTGTWSVAQQWREEVLTVLRKVHARD